jgi:hypothetical protein
MTEQEMRMRDRELRKKAHCGAEGNDEYIRLLGIECRNDPAFFAAWKRWKQLDPEQWIGGEVTPESKAMAVQFRIRMLELGVDTWGKGNPHHGWIDHIADSIEYGMAHFDPTTDIITSTERAVALNGNFQRLQVTKDGTKILEGHFPHEPEQK